MKLKDKVFIAICIGLLIMNIFSYIHLKEMKESMSNIQNQVSNLNRGINGIERNVSNTLYKMSEKDKWLYNQNYSVTNISKDFKNADVSLNWSLRKLDNNSKVYLIYRKKPTDKNENDKWTELPIENVDTLNYTKELPLSLDNDYEFKVLVKGDATSTSENLLDINLYSIMKDRVQINLEPEGKSIDSNNHVELKFSGRIMNSYDLPFKNYMSGQDLLKLKNVTVKVYSNDDLIEEFKIYKNGKIIDENTKFGPFHDHGELNRESIEFTKTIEYDAANKNSEVFEIIVENYSGRIYSSKSHAF